MISEPTVISHFWTYLCKLLFKSWVMIAVSQFAQVHSSCACLILCAAWTSNLQRFSKQKNYDRSELAYMSEYNNSISAENEEKRIRNVDLLTTKYCKAASNSRTQSLCLFRIFNGWIDFLFILSFTIQWNWDKEIIVSGKSWNMVPRFGTHLTSRDHHRLQRSAW